MSKKNNLVPLVSIMVVRDGRRVAPPIGKAFPFEDEEIKVLKEGTHYRAAVNEDDEADLAAIKPERNSAGHPKTNAKGAGNTTAMKDGADGAGTTEGEAGQDSDSNKAGKAKTPAQAKTAVAAAPVDDL